MGKGEITRQRILEEAVSLASRNGLGGLTIGSLATSLDLSKSGLFSHFGSKEALQVAVLRHTSEAFRQHLGDRLEGRAGKDRARVLLEAWLDWIDRPVLPGGCPLMRAAFELEGQGGEPESTMRELHGRSEALVRSVLADCVADPAQGAFQWKGLVLAYHHASRVLRDPEARIRARRALERLLEDAGA